MVLAGAVARQRNGRLPRLVIFGGYPGKTKKGARQVRETPTNCATGDFPSIFNSAVAPVAVGRKKKRGVWGKRIVEGAWGIRVSSTNRKRRRKCVRHAKEALQATRNYEKGRGGDRQRQAAH